MQIQAEANLSALMESTEDLIWSVDLNDRLVTFNGALQRHIESTFGIRLASGMLPRDIVPPERASLLPPLYKRVRAEGSVRIEFSLADGRVLDLALSPILVDGAITGVSVFGKDISKRKAAERALHEAERKYRSIFDGALEGIFQTTREGKLLTANPALAKMLGYDSAEELLSTAGNVVEAIWGDPQERSRYLRQLEECGASLGFECRLRRKDGRNIWASLNARKVCGSDGQLLNYEGFIIDITEHKRAEEAQRESMDDLKEAQAIGTLGSYVLNIPTGVWTSSSVMDEIFGIGKEYQHNVVGWAALVHPADRAMMTAYFVDEVMGQRKAFDKEYRIVQQTDGTERWVHGMGRLDFDAQGKPLKLHGVIKDITEHKIAEMKLRDSEERYRATFEQAPVGVVHTSFDGLILRCNARFAEILGYPPEEIPGKTVQQLTAPEDMTLSVGHLQSDSTGAAKTSTFEKRFVRKDGTLTWAKLTISIQRDGGGSPMHFITFAEDINARKAAEERLASAADALRVSEERYRTAFQTSRDSININRLSDGKYIDVNQAFLDITGYDRDEVIGKTSLELGIWADPRDRLAMTDMMGRSSNCHNLEVQFRKKDGTVFWGQMSGSLMEVNGVPCVLSVTRDLSESKAAASTIQSLAFYDPLTGLPNRRLLFERLGQNLADGARSGRLKALLLIDLDNLKTLNDTLGHHIGDLLLKEVALRVAACARPGSTVGRLGGDEFIVVLDELSEVAEEAATQAKAVGEAILAAIGQPCLLDNRECLPAASLGITVFGDQENTADEILQKADIALHRAKAAGRNTLRFFSPALQAVVNAHAELEKDLRRAMKAKQFLLYYQPQIERGHLTGAEALIRWVHPVRGIVSPDDFIPLAEETKLILPLGDWVLETACKQIAAWAAPKQSAHLTISVNISALQFRQPGFVEHVLDALDRTGANPKNLKLELTESMLVENFEEVIAKMTELKSRGLSFSLDDFGTGYSSLAYLKRLPLDQLKIDRTFVRDILVDVTSGAIAQTIISLGRAMDLSVVAEGVESEEQRGFLAGLGCHCFQGDLFSPPLPIEEFQAFL